MTSVNQDIRVSLIKDAPSSELPKQLLSELDQTVVFFNEETGNQFRRRVLYRNSFAYVEGLMHYLKVSTYSSYRRIVHPLLEYWGDYANLPIPTNFPFRHIDEDILLALLDKKVVVSDQGDWKLKEDWVSTAANVRFTHKVICQIYQIDPGENTFGDQGWQKFKACINTRNRVTHPKITEEFKITEEEVKDLQIALDWFQKITNHLMREVVKALKWDNIRRLSEDLPSEMRGEFLKLFAKKSGLSWIDPKSLGG